MITFDCLRKQENDVKCKTCNKYGKFCDFTIDGIELMIQGILYLINKEEPDEKNEFEDFDSYFRFFAFTHYNTVCYTLMAAYNLLLTGYYSQSAILLRNIIETFVRLRYIKLKREKEYIRNAWSGDNFTKINENKKKHIIKYKEIFDSISPEMYEPYIGLSKHSHGNINAISFKTVDNGEKLYPDPGLIFKKELAEYIMYQYSVFLLAHLKFMMEIFPEVNKKMQKEYKKKYNKTIKRIWRVLDFPDKENNDWYIASKKLLENI